MGVLRHRKHQNHCYQYLLPAITTFLLFSCASSSSQPTKHSRQYVEHKQKGLVLQPMPGGSGEEEKRFGGPGSSPPSCRSKCGWCSPCQPVHVPVQPGLIIRLEYYPEAWRCKCANKLFMP